MCYYMLTVRRSSYYFLYLVMLRLSGSSVAGLDHFKWRGQAGVTCDFRGTKYINQRGGSRLNTTGALATLAPPL